MPETNSARYSRIVFRLRASLLVIVLLLLLGAIVASIQLTHLNRSQSQAIDISVPALVNSHKQESYLAKILLLQGQIRSADNNEITEHLANRIYELKSNIDQSGALSLEDRDEIIFLRISQRLDELDSSLLPIRIKINSSIESLSVKRESLRGLRSQFRDLIEPRLVETQTALNNLLLSENLVDSGSIGTSILLVDLVDLQKRLTEISFRYLAVADAAEELSWRVDNSSTNDTTVQIRYNIRELAQILVSLKNDTFRRDLAFLANALRALVVGQDGIMAELEKKSTYLTKFESAQLQQAKHISTLSKEIDNVVSTATNEITNSARIFRRALIQNMAVLFLVSLLIIGIVLLQNYFIIERQINQRISLLTGAVLDIAKGDTKRAVSIQGHDEIGVMAESLKVFKDTALKLRTSNEELEQFAYAASHDLRSPLRAIEHLAQWTIEDAGDSLPKSCYKNLEKILGRAKRLSTLQTDLLEYSRAGHSGGNIESLNIKSLITELSELLDSQQNFNLTVTGFTDSFNTHNTPLRQVLINLITNAIKHHDRESGKIEVSISQNGARVNISVRDDGAGIEPEYQEQIFGLFNKLESQDKVEGSGLGLALVRKLVMRYGGEVIIESNPSIQRGTVFSFDWPMYSPNILIN